MKLSTQLQERNGVAVLTFFPSEDLALDLADRLGERVFKCADLIKIRLWARRSRDSWVVQIVPIITLHAMSEKVLQLFNEHLLKMLFADSAPGAKLVCATESARARQRLSQFILSAALGQRFMAGLEARVGRELRWSYDDEEADRHFGPWFHDEMAVLSRNAARRLLSPGVQPLPSPKLKVAKIPKSVRDWTVASISSKSHDVQRTQHRSRSSSLLADFAEIFCRIYDNREIPAREEARALGANSLNDSVSTPNRDRLTKGVPWQLLVDHLIRLCKVPRSTHVIQTFSLLLDLCNDVGIAVPVTCVQGGVVYRGYRHGEDVKFSDGELALAHDVGAGFLETSGLTTIPRLTLEKLLVLLIKVGASRNFLEVLYGATGTDGVCKIGFDLHGARPMLMRGPANRPERNLWLTDYLISRQVFRAPKKANSRQGQYELGRRPEGNYLVSHAPDEAKDLGNIMGMLMPNARGRTAIIDEKAVTLLSTCSTPCHTAKALQVELSIFREWFDSFGNNELAMLNLDDETSVAEVLRLLLTSRGHEALHSAHFKYVGFKTDQCTKIIEAATRSLSKEPSLFARRWQSYWAPLQHAQLTEERRTFGPLIDRAASFCWQLAACLSAIEIALRYHQFLIGSSKNDRQLSIAFSKLRSYRIGMGSTGLIEPNVAARIAERFEEIGVLKQTEFRFHGNELVPGKASTGSGTAFDPLAAIRYARRQIDSLRQDVDSLLDLVDPLFDSWGKKSDRVDYSHMLYYDIIDSTATVAARRGQDVEDHRSRCRELKGYINRWFDRSIGEARRLGDEIFCVNGTKASTNDCKHIFLRGVNARIWAEKIIGVLSSTALSFGMLVRIYLVPCDFAGSLAYRQGIDPEVKGSRFWEHWSRIAKQCAGFEPKPSSNTHFLLIASEDLNERIKLDTSLVWSNTVDTIVASEIEFLGRNTFVRYGELTTDAKISE